MAFYKMFGGDLGDFLEDAYQPEVEQGWISSGNIMSFTLQKVLMVIGLVLLIIFGFIAANTYFFKSDQSEETDEETKLALSL